MSEDYSKLVEDEPLLNKITALTRQIRARGDERSADAMLEIYAGVLSIACNCDDQKVMRKEAERARDEAVAGLAVTVEDIAKAIYDVMPFDGPPHETKPAWFEGGNSLKQDEARRRAREALPATATSAARLIEAAVEWWRGEPNAEGNLVTAVSAHMKATGRE